MARAARRERQAAELLGSRRVHRSRYESAPDVEPVRLPDGTLLVPESKTRGKLPKWIVGAVEQARGYLPGAVPLVVLSQTGGEPLGLMPLRDLSRLLGLRQTGEPAQLPIADGAAQATTDGGELATVAAQLGRDERRVLLAIARRLSLGARAYGPLDIAGDRRDWVKEAAEEACDQAVYLACAVLRDGAR